jgi:hypothetical protein
VLYFTIYFTVLRIREVTTVQNFGFMCCNYQVIETVLSEIMLGSEWLMYIIYSCNIRWHLYMDKNFSREVGVLNFFL